MLAKLEETKRTPSYDLASEDIASTYLWSKVCKEVAFWIYLTTYYQEWTKRKQEICWFVQVHGWAAYSNNNYISMCC